MKIKMRIISCVAVVVMAVMAVAGLSAKSDEKPSMKVEEKVHDFGNIREDGGPVSCDFTFTNDGKGNLVIFDATAECGCTRPSYPKAPVAPGKSGKISVVYNPLGRPGAFDKTVTIKCNGKPSKVRLKVRGTVIPK